MCDTCGCHSEEKYVITEPGSSSNTEHHHAHHHDHGHEHTHSRTIDIQHDALTQNNLNAAHNRGHLEALNIRCINLVSSPGAGKTSLLEKTIKKLKNINTIYVIEGDQQTSNDAKRIDKAGARSLQINTGSGCHLDAEMVHDAIHRLQPQANSILFIENVGNLVCPALFDLGETKRVVIISVTEGEDKPLKYPYMFESSDLCLINKTDLLPYLDDIDINRIEQYTRQVHPEIKCLPLSVKSEEGIDAWIEWLKSI